MSFIKYLIAGGLGFGVAKLLGNKKEKDYSFYNPNQYTIYAKSDDNDKIKMDFFNFDDAKKMYDKILKAKKIRYRDIIEYDNTEKEYYNKWSEEGNIGKKGYPKLTDISPIQEMTFYINNDEIFSFEN